MKTDRNVIGNLLRELAAEVSFFIKPLYDKTEVQKKDPDITRLSAIERRLFVRSVFAFIEGVVFEVKAAALISEKAKTLLSAGELALAKEEDYELNDNGSVESRPARLRFKPNFRFAFALASKVNDISWEPDVTGAGWQALLNSIPVRDRLTHPKKITDLEVTDKEVRDAMAAFSWVFDQLGQMAARSLLR